MSHCPYETLPGLDGRAVSYTGGGTPSVHRYPSPNLSPEPREIELVQISEASRKERPQVLIPSPRGGDSAAEAAVRLQAKSLRSEGASIQSMCSAKAVLFVLLTGACG